MQAESRARPEHYVEVKSGSQRARARRPAEEDAAAVFPGHRPLSGHNSRGSQAGRHPDTGASFQRARGDNCLHSIMLCCAVPCRAVLCCAVLCCAVLCCALSSILSCQCGFHWPSQHELQSRSGPHLALERLEMGGGRVPRDEFRAETMLCSGSHCNTPHYAALAASHWPSS